MKPDQSLLRIDYRKVRQILVLILLIVSLGILWILSSRFLMQDFRIQRQAFAQIWAAGRLILQGENPYNPQAIQNMKNQISGIDRHPQVVAILYTPPWTMPLAAIYSLLPYLAGRLLWLLTSISILLLSAAVLWKLYGGSHQKRWVAWLVVFTFGPGYGNTVNWR